jgi:hypothetical protein
MPGHSDQQPPQTTGATAVPDLIELYRSRRDAWIAQADELARLRDEVRGSAEREAMEIVTAARRDVRKVITDARRELLVLSAQVQAALGEAIPNTDPATLLDKAGIIGDPEAKRLLTGTSANPFAPEAAVNEILSEAQADITALVEDARALPLQAVPLRQVAAPSAASPMEAITLPPPRVVPSPAAEPPIEIPEISMTSPGPERGDRPGLSESASKVLLSSPFPSDSVPVLNDRRLPALVALSVGIVATVAGITIWWLASGNSSSEAAVVPASATNEATPASVAGEPSSPRSAGEKSIVPRTANLSVVADAVRDVWIRTTIDGRADSGRTLAAGESVDISAERSVSLRVGDAGAIVVSVNKKEKRPLGRDGEVVTRLFVVEGAAEPARAPAAQPAPAPAAPAPAPAAPSTPARVLPPVASAAPPASAPRVATPASIPSSATNVATANPPSPAPTPAATTPAPAASQTTTAPSQLAVPGGVVNQPSALAAPAAAPTAAPAPTSPAMVVVAVARQWLDAYHRQDRATMTALSTDNLLLTDERRTDERFPAGTLDVTRTLDRVSVQIAADTAVLTAVMMEQSSSGASAHVSPISQVWVLGDGQWRVRQARFVSEARLNQVFK